MVELTRKRLSFIEGLLLKKLFTAFGRPDLELAKLIWAPYLKNHINTLKAAQYCTANVMDGYKILNFTERL